MKVVEGKHDEGYRVPPQCMKVIKEKNPKSFCLINWTDQRPTPLSRGVPFCVGSEIATFKPKCRPFYRH